MAEPLAGFIDFFRQVPDHRIARRKLYPVEEILLLVFCGVIAGCEGWNDLELFGQTRLEQLRHYLPFEAGIPSDDTLRRFFRELDPTHFESCFMAWVKSMQLELQSKVVAIDGKTSRRSFDLDPGPLHLISAFASEYGIVLGQLKVADKSNEITAIPELLALLDITGATVTIDAMGCQTKVAQQILARNAHYVLGLKGNQRELHKEVKTLFADPPATLHFRLAEEGNKGHGRLETRRCKVTAPIDWLRTHYPRWPQLHSVVEIESIRTIGTRSTTEKRYYITSLGPDPQRLLEATRQHWGIENKLHWVLDVCFGDDHSRIRKGHAARNMAIIKKTALNLLNMIKPHRPRTSLKQMRKLAGWDPNFLHQVLAATF